MLRKPNLLLAGLSVLAILAAGQARATVYYVTYTGTASGTDTSGLFGTAGTVLNNVAFTSTYTYDPSLFGTAAQNNSSAYAQVYGGIQYGSTDPILSASITINGLTFNQGGDIGADALVGSTVTERGNTGPYIQDHVVGATGDLFNYGVLDGTPLSSLTAVQSFRFVAGQNSGELAYNGATLTLSDTFVSVTAGPPTPVPEPASSALLAVVAGVFAAGSSARRRTTSPSA